MLFNYRIQNRKVFIWHKNPRPDIFEFSAAFSLFCAVARVSETIVLYINSPACLPAIKEVLAKENSGRGSVIIVAQAQGYQVEIKLADGYSLSASATTALRAIPGIYQVKQF